MATTPHQQPPEEAPINQGTAALLSTLNVGFRILRYLLILMLIGYLFSGFFILESNQQAYVLHFGRVVGEPGQQVLESGRWHIALPKYMSEIVRVPTGEVQTLTTSHFWNAGPERNILTNPDQPPDPGPEGGGLAPGVEAQGYLLTTNSDILHTRWQLTYFVTDPIAFTTHYADPEAVIKTTLENVVLKELATTNIEEALYAGSSALTTRIEERLAVALNRLDIGIQLTDDPGLVFLDKQPPQATQAAFNLVLEADQEQGERIESARTDANRLLSEARSHRQQLITESRAYATNMISKVIADKDYFTSILDEVDRMVAENAELPADGQQDPKSIILALYVDTLLEVLETVESKYVAYPSKEVRVHISPRRESPNTPERGAYGGGH